MAANSSFPRIDHHQHANALDIVRETFAWLVTGPHPVAVDGRLFPGLPDRAIALDELRERLLNRNCHQTTRDAVWAHLISRSRRDGATWTVAAVGMALPALTSVAATLSARFAGDPADIHAEMVHGFLAALSTIDVDRPRIMLRLRWEAYRAGYRALADALSAPTPISTGFYSSPPRPRAGHPDLVLARAVADNILTRLEADLIGSTRLDKIPVAEWAARREVSQWSAYKLRTSAEARLVAYLTNQPQQKHSSRSSKNDRKSGVQYRGPVVSTPDASEAPRCA